MNDTRARRLVAAKDAADYGRTSLRTIYRWIDKGILPAYRYGPKVLRVDLDELDRLLQPARINLDGE